VPDNKGAQVDTNESLLRAVLSTLGRQAFTPGAIAKILSVGVGGKKQIAAYNLCDGMTPQAEIGRRAGLDKGSLSRSLTRWINAGILFRVGPDQHPLHIYPLSKDIKEE